MHTIWRIVHYMASCTLHSTLTRNIVCTTAFNAQGCLCLGPAVCVFIEFLVWRNNNNKRAPSTVNLKVHCIAHYMQCEVQRLVCSTAFSVHKCTRKNTRGDKTRDVTRRDKTRDETRQVTRKETSHEIRQEKRQETRRETRRDKSRDETRDETRHDLTCYLKVQCTVYSTKCRVYMS